MMAQRSDGVAHLNPLALDATVQEQQVAGLTSHDSFDGVAQAVSDALRTMEEAKLPPPPWAPVPNQVRLRPSQVREQQLKDYLDPPPAWGLRVNLASLYIGPKHCRAIADAMILNRTVTTLDLSMCDMGTEAALRLVECLRRNPVLQHLNLGGNFLDPPVGVALGAYLAADGCPLNSLSLACNNLRDEGVVAIAAALRGNPRSKLSFLNVRGNHLTDVSGRVLLDAIRKENNEAVNALWVQVNAISEEVVNEITQVCSSKFPEPPVPIEKKKKKKKGQKGDAQGKTK